MPVVQVTRGRSSERLEWEPTSRARGKYGRSGRAAGIQRRIMRFDGPPGAGARVWRRASRGARGCGGGPLEHGAHGIEGQVECWCKLARHNTLRRAGSGHAKQESGDDAGAGGRGGEGAPRGGLSSRGKKVLVLRHRQRRRFSASGLAEFLKD